ncbi:MAG: hypothetical protein K0S26_1338 [Bacteroidota bacterium]|jgi:hypothetical protein|nr:hypothetical protein [Bacteroidota bacterium]
MKTQTLKRMTDITLCSTLILLAAIITKATIINIQYLYGSEKG